VKCFRELLFFPTVMMTRFYKYY